MVLPKTNVRHWVPAVAVIMLNVQLDTAQGTTIVSPNGLETTEGNSFGSAPTAFTRVQYLYPSSDFSPLLLQQLVGIAWRPDEATGPVTTSTASFAVRVSTTSATVLSTTFADNIGADETLVFDGPLTISTAADHTPRGFDFALPFQTPFHYDPTKGNLLVEFSTTGFDVGGWRVDNQNSSSGPTLVQSGNPSHTVAPSSFNTLAVMQFTFASQSPELHGDYNGDGTVDAADYVVWRKGLGTTYTQSDYNVWRANFAKTAGSGEALPSAQPLPAAIPEPHSFVVGVIVLLAVTFCRAQAGRRCQGRQNERGRAACNDSSVNSVSNVTLD